MVADEGEVSREQKEARRKHYVFESFAAVVTLGLCATCTESRFDMKYELHMSQRDS